MTFRAKVDAPPTEEALADLIAAAHEEDEAEILL